MLREHESDGGANSGAMPTPASVVPIIALLLSIAGLAIGGMRTYGEDTIGMRERVSVLETRQYEMMRRIGEIETRLHRIEDKIDGLIRGQRQK